MLILKTANSSKLIYAQTCKNTFVREEKADGGTSKIVISGFASTPTEDSYSDIVEPRAFSETMDRYEKNPIILLQHKMDKPIGQVVEWKLWNGGLEVKGEILHDVDGCMEQIISGTLRGFSIGFRLLEWVEDTTRPLIRTITKLELVEISVVSVPANPDTVFTFEKSLKKFFDEIEEKDIISEEIQNIPPTEISETDGETPPPTKGENESEDTPPEGTGEEEVKALIENATKELAETLAIVQQDLARAQEENVSLTARLEEVESQKSIIQKSLDEANHLIDTTEIRTKSTGEAKKMSDKQKLASYYSKSMSGIVSR